MELNKLEAYASRGHMGPYSAQIAELIAIIRRQERELAVYRNAPLIDAGLLESAVESAANKHRTNEIGHESMENLVQFVRDVFDAIASQSTEAKP